LRITRFGRIDQSNKTFGREAASYGTNRGHVS